jgi:hypothetical protein
MVSILCLSLYIFQACPVTTHEPSRWQTRETANAGNKSKVDQRLQEAEKLRKMAAALKGMMAPAISNPTTPPIIFLKSQKPSLTFCV